jgi:L-rhamnose mutarotase
LEQLSLEMKLSRANATEISTETGSSEGEKSSSDCTECSTHVRHYQRMQGVRKKGLQALRGYSIRLNDPEAPLIVCPEVSACQDMGEISRSSHIEEWKKIPEPV